MKVLITFLPNNVSMQQQWYLINMKLKLKCNNESFVIKKQITYTLWFVIIEKKKSYFFTIYLSKKVSIMDYYRQKYRAGVIDVKTFERMMEVINHLQEKGYEFQKAIGDGSFGSVLKVKHSTTGEELAAKVVRKDYASDGEVNIWKKLNHENILKLIDVQYAYFADSYIFMMPFYPKNLEEVIWDTTFTSNKNALQMAKEWLKQIIHATANLHDQSLSHNDIKMNNILIADNNKAILADFGFLATTEIKTKK